MIGYKPAKTEDKKVLITLEIPEDAITNISRESVIVKNTAAYKSNTVKVLKIEDADGIEYKSCVSCYDDNKKLTYTVGKIIKDSSSLTTMEKYGPSGILFFLDMNVAKSYTYGFITDGIITKYFADGTKMSEENYSNGKRNGICPRWHYTGEKLHEESYTNGKRNGMFKEWHANGQLASEVMYEDDKKIGMYRQWHKNGYRHIQVMYKDGLMDGIYNQWHTNGNDRIQHTFVDGIMV